MISLKQFHEANAGVMPSRSEESQEIEILLAGVIFGPYSEDKVRERLAEGLLTPGDQARLVSSEDWITVEEFLTRLPTGTVKPTPRAPAMESPSSGFLTGPIPHLSSMAPAFSPAPVPAKNVAEEITARPATTALPLFEASAPAAEALEEKTPGPRREESSEPGVTAAEIAEAPPTAPARETAAAPSETSPLRGRKIIPPTGPAGVTHSGKLRAQILARTSQEPLKTSTPLSVPGPTVRQIQIRSRTRMLPSLKPPVASGSAPAVPSGESSAPETTAPSVEATEPGALAAAPAKLPANRATLMGPESPSSMRTRVVRAAVPPRPVGAMPTQAPPPLPEAAAASTDSPEPPKSAAAQATPPPAVMPARRVALMGPEPRSAIRPRVINEPRGLPGAVVSGSLVQPGKPANDASILPQMPESKTGGSGARAAESAQEDMALRATPLGGESTASVTANLSSETVAATPSEGTAQPVERRPSRPLSSVLAVRLPARKTQKLQPAPPLPGLRSPEKKETVRIAHPPGARVGSASETAETSKLAAPAAGLGPATSPDSGSGTLNPGSSTVAKLASLAGPHAASNSASTAPTATTIHLVTPTAKPSTPAVTPGTPPSSSEPDLKQNSSADTSDSKTPAEMDFAALEPSRPETLPIRRNAMRTATRRQRRVFLFAGSGLVAFILLCGAIYYFFAAHKSRNPAVEPASAPAGEAKTSTAGNSAAAGISAEQAEPSDHSAANPPATTSNDPRTAAHFTTGMADQASGNLDGAIAEFTQALQIDPKFAQGYSYRATVRMAKNDLDGALADDDQLLALEPDNSGGFCQRGFIKQAKGDTDGAIADYTRAIELDPKSYIAFYNRGLIREDKGDFSAALADYNEAIELNPQLAGAYYHRGNVKSSKADSDGAIADYTHALEINPNLALAYCNRALAEQNTGNLNAAFNDYSQALTIDPKIATAYYNRGLIKEQRNDLQGAIDDSTKTLELDPKNAQAYYNRGVALQAKGNLDAAANDLRKFAEISPKDVYADYSHLYLWIIMSQEGRKAEADHELSGTLDSSWNAEPGQLPSKIANFLLGKVSEAELLALAASPDAKKDQGQHCEIWYFAGVKDMLDGDKPGAIRYFRRCLSTGEKDFCEYILAQGQLQNLNAG